MPRSACAVQTFLVLVDYYRRFVKGYGDVVAPLT
jgi:hypothetical protein